MFLTVTLLLGRRYSLKVSGKESIATLKKLVSQRLQVPEEQQHLLFRGQLLADDKHLSDYSIGPNASINVIMRPPEEATLDKVKQPLWHQLGQVLAKHFGPQDAEAVLALLRQEHEERLRRLSLDALEELVGKFLAEQQVEKPKEEAEEEEEEEEKCPSVASKSSPLLQQQDGEGGGEEKEEDSKEEEEEEEESQEKESQEEEALQETDQQTGPS